MRERVERRQAARIALVGPTTADVRDVMVEGDSGILAISPPRFRPEYQPSKRRLTWPNGAIATTYSADKPERLRGPQHDFAWCDEAAVWRYGPEAWDMLMFGLRLGESPQAVVTTTPKPVKLIRELLSRRDKDVVVTHGTTYDNRGNLARTFLETIVRRYEGTRLGRQELLAELLEDIPGALWQRSRIEELRVLVVPHLTRIVVAIDPATSTEEKSDETGIVVAGVAENGHGYVLNDLSGRYSPIEWAKKAIAAYRLYKADLIVAEVNNGGDMVEATLRSVSDSIPYRAVHASRGKAIRAEPISALYEQGRVHHVGTLAALEDQQCAFTIDFDRASAGYSPDRLDAVVWALTELMGDGDFEGWVEYVKREAAQQRLMDEPGKLRLPGAREPKSAPPTDPEEQDLIEVYHRALAAADDGQKRKDLCAGCGEPVEGDRVENDRVWHPRCFKPF